MSIFTQMGISDHHFDRQLDAWLAKDDEASDVADEAYQLALQAINDPSSEYYHLSSKNISQAICDLTCDDKFVAELVSMVAAENLDTAKFMADAVKKYLFKCAKEHFDDEIWERKHSERDDY